VSRPPTDTLQLNAVKELVGLPATARAFQAAGITALLFDPRGVGLSDGEPRNDINPFREIDDLCDALRFLLGHPAIAAKAPVGLWGMSLGGATAMCAAALDPRARFVVAVCPATEYSYDRSKLRGVLAKAARDRESRLKGNEPFYLPMISASGDNPAGFNLGTDRAAALRIVRAQDPSDALRQSLTPHHVNRTTLATYRNLVLWHPRHMWQYLDVTPVMMVVPEQDQLVGTAVLKEHFESLPGPKRLHVQEGVGHMDILEGPAQVEVNARLVAFVEDVLEGRLESR